jgi:hypothetical protein
MKAALTYPQKKTQKAQIMSTTQYVLQEVSGLCTFCLIF